MLFIGYFWLRHVGHEGVRVALAQVIATCSTFMSWDTQHRAASNLAIECLVVTTLTACNDMCSCNLGAVLRYFLALRAPPLLSSLLDKPPGKETDRSSPRIGE